MKPKKIKAERGRRDRLVKHSSLDEKLAAIRYCIMREADEDALEHLFDFVCALRVRAAIRGMVPEQITQAGHASLSLLNP